MGLEIAELPAFAVAIQIALAFKSVADVAQNIALLPRFTVGIFCAVSRCRSALVGVGIAVLEVRVAN
jgi:hypothetical protein